MPQSGLRSAHIDRTRRRPLPSTLTLGRDVARHRATAVWHGDRWQAGTDRARTLRQAGPAPGRREQDVTLHAVVVRAPVPQRVPACAPGQPDRGRTDRVEESVAAVEPLLGKDDRLGGEGGQRHGDLPTSDVSESPPYARPCKRSTSCCVSAWKRARLSATWKRVGCRNTPWTLWTSSSFRAQARASERSPALSRWRRRRSRERPHDRATSRRGRGRAAAQSRPASGFPDRAGRRTRRCG